MLQQRCRHLGDSRRFRPWIGHALLSVLIIFKKAPENYTLGHGKTGPNKDCRKPKTAEKRRIAWELHTQGINQFKIAERLGCTQARVSQLIKEAAAEHPVVSLSLEERIALSEARWQRAEDSITAEIKRQLDEGREVVEVLTLPDGTQQKRVTHQKGPDPALLRCWSTHTDRRNRQIQNQLAPDTGITQVNVSMVKEFLQQGDGGGKLSAAEWNDSQTQRVVDV